MLRLKRRHRRNVLMGLLVLLSLSWASMGCYACELGSASSTQHAQLGDSASKPCHDEAADSACPHCAAFEDQHRDDGNCGAACKLYQASTDEQLGWSPIKAGHDVDFHPLLLTASLTMLGPQTLVTDVAHFTSSTHLDTHPTAAFCVLLI